MFKKLARLIVLPLSLILGAALATSVKPTSQVIPVKEPASPCSDMVFAGVFPKTTAATTVLCKRRYVIGYAQDQRAPLWTAEYLSAKSVRTAHDKKLQRVDNFRQDPSVPADHQSQLAEFARSGYDRGHQVPFEDLADDAVAADESFFMTNMVPQAPENNRQIWRSLEEKVRKLATQKGSIYVITGPIFDPKPQRLARGTPVPSKLYKIVISHSTQEVWTYIIPNVNGLDTASLPKYLVTLKDLHDQNPQLQPLPTAAQLKDMKVLPV